jgi:RsiW-degrading membrane proteinase PrsW (M82 family)
MNFLVPLSMAVAPAILLVVYFYKKDKQKPEPKELVFKVFAIGVAAIIPAILIELLLMRIFGFTQGSPFLFAFLRAFVVAALTEELLKLLVVKFYCFKQEAFDEVMDGIVYTIVASLGFACLENVMYVMGRGVMVAVLRAFTAVPMHAFVSGIMGYYIGRARFAESPGQRNNLIFKGLAIAVLLHGLYDFFLFSAPAISETAGEVAAGAVVLSVLIILIVSFIILKKLIRKAMAEDLEKGRV